MGKKKKEKIIEDINSRLNFKYKETSLREDCKVDAKRLKDLKEKEPQKYWLELEKFLAAYGIYYEEHGSDLLSFVHDEPVKLLGTINPALGSPSICGMQSEEERAFEIAFRFFSSIPGMQIKINPDNRLIVEINPNAHREIIHFYLDLLLNKIEKPFQKKRFRKESINALTVWELRRLRKPFKEIAKELKIKESVAKKNYYRAYEIICGKKYNPADFEKPEINKKYLKKECSTCQEKATCTVLCPSVMAYVDQDIKSYLREHLTP